MTRYAHVIGWGMYTPQKVLTNQEISQIVDTSDEWIQTRTGVKERRIAADNESTATLATQAALRALIMGGVRPSELDLIIVSSSSPEHIFPATASLVQDALGASRAGAFDLLAACTGFIYAMDMASHAIISGSIDTALVIGAETLSRLTDWSDRGTCILFGDGAGAFLLQASDKPGGYVASVLRSDGSGGDLLILPAGGSKEPASFDTVKNGKHYIHMNGREVFRFATRVMANATREVVEKANLDLDEISLIIPHQANKRIIEAAAKNLKMDLDRFYINLDKYGNTSTASIPIATVEALNEGKIHPGDRLVFVGFGAGLTWGALLLEWTGALEETRLVRRKWLRVGAVLRSWLLRLLRRLESLLTRMG